MLKKIFTMVFLLCVLCCSANADVIYRSLNDDDDDFVYTKLSIDASGNFQESALPLKSGVWSDFSIVKVSNKELMMIFERGNKAGQDKYNTNVSTFDMSNLSKPIASKTFSYPSLIISELNSTPVVWGNNILLNCKNNTIVELDPFTLSEISRYEYVEENLPDYLKRDADIDGAYVIVCNGKIYAMFDSVEYSKLTANTASIQVSDGGPQSFNYFVEMSSLGTITRELQDLYIGRNCYNLTNIDGKLYVDYEEYNNEKGICSLNNALKLDKIILFPQDVSRESYFSFSCSDGNGGFYFTAYQAKTYSIYHYDGSEIKKVYTLLNLEENFARPYVTQMEYDSQSGMIFVVVSENEQNRKLVALKPNSEEKITSVKEISNVSWFELTTSQTDDNASSETQEQETSRNNDQETTQDVTNKTSSESSSGGCNSINFGFLFSCVLLIILRSVFYAK